MNRAGAGGRHANAGTAGKFRVSDGHERGHLFVSRLDEVDPAIVRIEGAHQAIDAVTGISEHVGDAPLGETLEDLIADILAHLAPRSVCSAKRASPPRSLEGAPRAARCKMKQTAYPFRAAACGRPRG